MRLKYITLLMPMLIWSCSDDKEYVPAQPEAPDCMGVYFDANAEPSMIFIPGEDATVTVNVHRINCDKAADVPLVAKCSSDAVVFPQSVHFDAGNSDASFDIDFGNLPQKQLASYTVTVADEYLHHYLAKPFDFSGTAIVSQWENAMADGSDVKFYFSETSYAMYPSQKVIDAVYQPVESKMEVLPGAGLVRVYDFLNTGVDITFSLTPSPFDDFAGYYRLSPVDNYVTMAEVQEDEETYGDSYYNAWYLYDDINDDYVSAYLVDLDGKDSELEYPLFYWYSNSYAYEYSVVSLGSGSQGNWASLGISGVPAVGISLPAYFYLNFNWDGLTGL